MKHTLKISVSKKPLGCGIISYRNITLREKLLCFLFGERQKLTVIIPGDSVESLSINEVGEEGGAGNEQNQAASECSV